MAAMVALAALILFLGARRHFRAEHYIQLIIDGIRGGSIYALIALGFVVIHSVTGIINFAQGEFVMLGAMVCVTIYHSELPLPPALKLVMAGLLAVLATTLVGVVLERAAIYPARPSDESGVLTQPRTWGKMSNEACRRAGVKVKVCWCMGSHIGLWRPSEEQTLRRRSHETLVFPG